MNRVQALLVFVIFLFGVGCTHKPSTTLRVGLVNWIGYAPLYVAEAKGWLPNNIKIVDFPSNYDIIEALKLGTLESAALTLDEVLINYRDLNSYKAVWLIDYSNGADAIVAAPEIKSLQDLRHKRVAFEPKSVQEYLLDRALQKGNLTRGDIIPKPLKYDEALTAWKQKRVDAAATFEPIKTELINNGMHTVFDSSQIPYEIIDLLVVHNSLIKTFTLKKLIQAYQKGVTFIQADPDSSMQIVANYLHITPREARDALMGVQLPGCSTNKHVYRSKALQKHIFKVASIVQEEGYVQYTPKIQNLFSFALIDSCEESR
ncbi:ABC transporter substrate-binding protein [Nitratiruptor sp. SB155-2]|uniref:ABC transporter substrate-binding protein n=1 Tax=Nitratiruptor sp. (strain SB155-2) TaxID=387092 RepID=UPI0001587091|nr:ABC transporter substrate-binding protein [Nitratiruptor sp. SB155-2]BAF70862.1 nitrate/sulfonate/bicarbonate ABC transporter, substrate-binding protein [Nitratiruptor sp. SB155-2]